MEVVCQLKEDERQEKYKKELFILPFCFEMLEFTQKIYSLIRGGISNKSSLI
jgi:hypothetical protein